MTWKNLCTSFAVACLLGTGSTLAGETYTGTPVSAVWAFDNATDYLEATVTPQGGFSIATADLGSATVVGTCTTKYDPDVQHLKIKPASSASDIIKWVVKPARGVTFTPAKVSGHIMRCGTDALDGVIVAALLDDGTRVELGTYTAPRDSKPTDEDKYKTAENWTPVFDITLTEAQKAQLATSGSFTLTATIGVNSSKQAGFGDIHIEGTLDGTAEDVNKYTLTAKANPEDAALITIYPNLAQYEEGSTVTLNAERNFGYSFVNWTDATGKEISATPRFDYTVNAESHLTANFSPVPVHELKYQALGGANPYQIQPTPAPDMTDGRMMYEDGTKVTLTAISNPIVAFTNWSDGQSSTEISFTMDADKEVDGLFSAVDYLAGWDFYLSGASGRPADFHSSDNDAAALVLRDADGNQQGWLDKSQEAAGGFEGRPGAVNWRTDGLGKWYWQTTLNAEAFTDMNVIGAMCYNYNTYTRQDVEVSTDEQSWEKIGTVTLAGAKNWIDYTCAIPAKYNNAPRLSIRWIADKTSPVDGTTVSQDGICLGATYITGTMKLVNDGTAPVLVSQVPAEGTDNASINGKIVLTFDEKVKVAPGTTGTLDGRSLEPTVSGATVMFAYKNLTYGHDYEFTLPAGAVMDLCDNATTAPIRIAFTTRTKPEVAKAPYDFIVPDNGPLEQAIAAAAERTDKSKRFRIFIRNGNYRLPASATRTKTGSDKQSYPDPTTYVATPNISFIGESMEGVVITNTLPANNPSVLEGIGQGDVMRLEGSATGCYFQNLTLKSSMGDGKGRDIVLNDNADKTIFKDACLWAYQDTYVSNNQNGVFYFEGGLLRGRTDFLCGKGDVFYQAVTLQMCTDGGYLAVPSNPRKYGYVFNDCEIVGETSGVNGKYYLGRPWGSGTPTASFINTRMTAQPAAAGWAEMSGGWPARFAEYNSTTASGTVIDLKDRKKTFADTHTNNPILTKEEAEQLTMANTIGDKDDWDPTLLTEQAPQPEMVVCDGSVITWNDSPYASLWAVCADGRVIDFTTEPTYSLTAPAAVAAADAASARAIVYSVRAANEMGGLGEAVEALDPSAIARPDATRQVLSTECYNMQGIRVAPTATGVIIKVTTYTDGTTSTVKTIVK